MICVSLQNKSYEQILEILAREDVEMAEVRLDLCKLSDEQIEDIFANSDVPLIATCRSCIAEGGIGTKEAERRLKIAIEAGARFADLEIEAPAAMSKSFQKLCKDCGTEIIRSFHDYEQTPSEEVLQMALARCFRYGADIAKIVSYAHSEQDNARIEALYSIVLEGVPSMQGRLVAFTMGELGQSTRSECLKRGAPFTYAALSTQDATAEGQLAYDVLSEQLYKGQFRYAASGLRMPASKSFAQRAIVAAALADGVSHLRSYSPCGDTDAALELARKIGAEVTINGDVLIIKGIANKKIGLDKLSVGESGLLARLSIPVLAAINGEDFTIEGRGTLLGRALGSASDIMAAFGVLLSDNHIPVRVKGRLIPGTANVPGSSGSQLISGLLMALPLCEGDSTLYVSDPKSIPYMYMTLDVLKHFGIKTRSEMEGDAELLEASDWSACSGIQFEIRGGQSYKSADFDIEGDWSAAAVYLAAGAVFGCVEISNLDMSSLQADLTMVDILVEAGAMISQMEDGTVCARKAPLEAFEQDLNNAPDLFPVVSVLAAFCAGETRLDGVGRLHSKESDRAKAILEMLAKLSVEARIEGDTMLICGESLAARLTSGRLLRGGEYSSHSDHRMVMALKLAALGADTPIVIDDEACVAKSFPGFSL